jgi:hypothetical protein
MKQHCARPRVEDSQSAETCAQIAGIGRELLESIGGRLHQQAVNFLRVRSSQWSEFCGESEGHQKIGTSREAVVLFVDPALGLRLMTLRTGAVAAGVIGKDFLLAVSALVEVASQQRRPAGGDIAQRAFLSRIEGTSVLPEIRLAVEADDVGHLQHEDLGIRGPA